MLPEQRAAAATDVGQCASHCQAGGEEETCVGNLVHQLHDGRRFERWESQQQQEGRDKLRPNEKWQPHPGHARRSQLNDRGNEIHRAQQRRSDQADHAEDPEGLAIGRNRGRQR